jgi:hypothetical protein
LPTALPDKTTTRAETPPTRYAFKASLVGAAHEFELTEGGLAWRVSGRSGLWPYDEISAMRLSYRPVSMQARRFRADINRAGGGRLTILSTSWQTAALMAPQDRDYRAFILELHARLARAGSRAVLAGGLGQKTYAAAIALLLLIASILAGLLIRALMIGEFAGALFLIGFAALFAWQVGGFVLRNRPLSYRFDHVPLALLP